MTPRRTERRGRWLRWLVPGALLALAPKCALCVLGYLSLGATLGLGGSEICGATGNATARASVWLLAAGAGLGAIAVVVRSRSSR